MRRYIKNTVILKDVSLRIRVTNGCTNCFRTSRKEWFRLERTEEQITKKLQTNLRQWPTWYTLALCYNAFLIILYMFRALYAHHQEVELYWCSIWYRHSQSVATDLNCIDAASDMVTLSQWPSGTQVERILSQPVYRTATDLNCIDTASDIVTLSQMLHQHNPASWWWAYNARNV